MGSSGGVEGREGALKEIFEALVKEVEGNEGMMMRRLGLRRMLGRFGRRI